jgi:hypothetical protein
LREGNIMQLIPFKSIYCAFITAICLFLAPASAQAQVINYQGYMTSSGNPVDYPLGINMRFSLWSAATGGTELWNEVQSVIVNQGIYSVKLGSVTPFPGTLDFTSPYYLQVEIDDGAGGWEVFSTRQELTHVPYAINSETVDGKHAAELDQSSHVTDTNNPHNVTAAQAGADPAGSAAAVQSNLDSHGANPSAHHAKTTSFTELSGQISDAQIPASITRDTELAALQATVTALQATVNTQASQIAALQDLLQHFSRSGNDVYISGANLHIVNGTGTTDGSPNALGNLIVGYNELRNDGTDDRTGSHNIVVGSSNNYTSSGGLVTGYWNTIIGAYATVTGGEYNTAAGDWSSVSGGSSNTAYGNGSSVSGGGNNAASGNESSVSGGINNNASGNWASISGGDYNTASGISASVSGGGGSIASGYRSSISGGYGNTASGYESSVSGGYGNTASGAWSSVSGGDYNIAFADDSSIAGGLYNLAGDGSCTWNGTAQRYECTAGTDHYVGQYSTVTGGNGNRTSGNNSSISGGEFNTTSGNVSSVSGGYGNTASGDDSSVSGGKSNTASGIYASISGGDYNHADGQYSSVSGGFANTASVEDSSVSGGWYNTAEGVGSSVSGGQNNTASGAYASVNGGGGPNPEDGNIAFADYSAILGGLNNLAGDGSCAYDSNAGRYVCTGGTDNSIGWNSTVSGGKINTASGPYSSVSGGSENSASDYHSSVSGGYQRSAPGINDWAAGGLFQDY